MAKVAKKKASTTKKKPAKKAATKAARKTGVGKKAPAKKVKRATSIAKAIVSAAKKKLRKRGTKSSAKSASKPSAKPAAKRVAKHAASAKKKPASRASITSSQTSVLESKTLEVPAPEPTHLPLEHHDDLIEQTKPTPQREISRAAMTSSASARSEHADPSASRAFAIDAARMIRDDKCEEVVLLDVRELGQVSDFIIIASGTSDRQMRSVAKNAEELGAQSGFNVYRREVDDRATWIIADFVDVVVHLFEPNTRSNYDLENLWADAPRIRWERPDQVVRDRVAAN